MIFLSRWANSFDCAWRTVGFNRRSTSRIVVDSFFMVFLSFNRFAFKDQSSHSHLLRSGDGVRSPSVSEGTAHGGRRHTQRSLRPDMPSLTVGLLTQTPGLKTGCGGSYFPYSIHRRARPLFVRTSGCKLSVNNFRMRLYSSAQLSSRSKPWSSTGYGATSHLVLRSSISFSISRTVS